MTQSYGPRLKEIAKAVVDRVNEQWALDRANLTEGLNVADLDPLAVLGWSPPDFRAFRVHVWPPRAPGLPKWPSGQVMAPTLKVPIDLWAKTLDKELVDDYLYDLAGLVVDGVEREATLGGKVIGPADGGDLFEFAEDPTREGAFLNQRMVVNVSAVIRG